MGPPAPGRWQAAQGGILRRGIAQLDQPHDRRRAIPPASPDWDYASAGRRNTPPHRRSAHPPTLWRCRSSADACGCRSGSRAAACRSRRRIVRRGVGIRARRPPPVSPWQATQTSCTFARPRSGSARARICRTSGVHDHLRNRRRRRPVERLRLRGRTRQDAERTADRGVGIDAGAAALHDRNDHDAQQITPTSTMPMTATVAQIRQGWSRTCGSDSARLGHARSYSHPMHDRGGRRRDHELRDGIAIGEEHQHEHQHVPQREAIERRRHPLRRMHGQRIERSRDRRQRAAVKHQRGCGRTAARRQAGRARRRTTR